MPWQWAKGQDGFLSREKKGASKAQSQGKEKKGEWSCDVSGCHATGKAANRAGRTTCHYCLMPKGSGSAVRQAERDTFRAKVCGPGQAPVAAAAKASAREAAPASIAPVVLPASASAPASAASPSASTGAAADRPTPLAFDEATLAGLADILPALAPLAKMLAEDYLPSRFTARATAQEIFDRCLSTHRPCTSQEARSKQEAQVSRLKAAVAAMGDDDSTETVALKSKLKVEEAAMAKLSNVMPSTTLETTSLASARARYIEACEERRDFCRRAKAKSEARRESRRSLLGALRSQIARAEESMAALDTAHTAAHEERARAHKALEQEVLALFDARAGAAVAQPVGGGDQLDAIIAEKVALQKRFVELEKQHQASLQPAAFDITFEDVSLADLPAAKVPVGPDLAVQGHVYHLLSAWIQSGANTQFTFQQLVNHGMLEDKVFEFLTSILGDVWKRWFAAEPLLSHVVPRQVALLLHHGLDRVRATWQADNALPGKAATAYAVLCGESKKRRAAH